MAYKKTEPKVNFSELEHEILDFWRSDDTFHKSLEKTKMGEPFNFYDGPPFANGLPHWGHLGVSTIKDMVSRYKTMCGRHVQRELGWVVMVYQRKQRLKNKKIEPQKKL